MNTALTKAGIIFSGVGTMLSAAITAATTDQVPEHLLTNPFAYLCVLMFGLLVWVLRTLLEKTIPNTQRAAAASLREQQAVFERTVDRMVGVLQNELSKQRQAHQTELHTLYALLEVKRMEEAETTKGN